MDFSSLSAEDVLISAFLSEYYKGIDFFHDQLIDLNTNIYIVEQIVQFPVRLFLVSEQLVFFEQVYQNFLDAGLLLITKMSSDQGQDLFTLRWFKNRVVQMVKPEYRSAFQKLLKQRDFDQRLWDVLAQAKRIRDQRIAHFTHDFATRGVTHRIQFSELKELRDVIVNLFEILTFDVNKILLPLTYSGYFYHPAGSRHGSDIEEILDIIARHSTLLNMPERDPEQWNHQRARMNEQQITQLNEYRAKFDLPKV